MKPQKRAWITRRSKICVVCNNMILNRSLKGKAITCNQKCAGKLAWETRLKD